MNSIISIIFIVVGIILLIYGFSSADSLSSRFSNFFAGHPTDKTVWLLIGGAVSLVIGVGSQIRGSRA